MTNISKKISLVAAIFLMCMCAQAQDIPDVQTGFRHTIGLNTVGIFDQFSDATQESPHRTPYLITYSVELGKLALRAGFGPEYSSETTVHDGFTDSEENTFLRLDGRIGAGVVILSDTKWQAIAGADLVGGYIRDRSIEDSGFDRITDQVETKNFGAGPFIQIAFQLSRRVSLGTDSALYWIHEKSTHTELFENFPDFNNVLSENSGSKLELTLPNTIFVRLHF